MRNEGLDVVAECRIVMSGVVRAIAVVSEILESNQHVYPRGLPQRTYNGIYWAIEITS